MSGLLRLRLITVWGEKYRLAGVLAGVQVDIQPRSRAYALHGGRNLAIRLRDLAGSGVMGHVAVLISPITLRLSSRGAAKSHRNNGLVVHI